MRSTGMISTESPGENGKVGMSVEELGSGLMRIRAHNRGCAHVIARIVDSTLRDLLGFPDGQPMLTMAARCFSTHALQAAMLERHR